MSNASEIELEVWVDGSLIEVMADAGSVCLTDLVYAEPEPSVLGLFHSAEAAVSSLVVFPIHSS